MNILLVRSVFVVVRVDVSAASALVSKPPDCAPHVGAHLHGMMFYGEPIFLNMVFVVRNDILKSHGNNKAAVVRTLHGITKICSEITTRQLNIGFHMLKVVFADDADSLHFRQHNARRKWKVKKFLLGYGTTEAECGIRYTGSDALSHWAFDLSLLESVGHITRADVAAWTGVTACFGQYRTMGVTYRDNMPHQLDSAAVRQLYPAVPSPSSILSNVAVMVHEWGHILGLHHAPKGIMLEYLLPEINDTSFEFDWSVSLPGTPGQPQELCGVIASLHQNASLRSQPISNDACREAESVPRHAGFNRRQPKVLRRDDFAVSLKCNHGYRGTVVATRCVQSGLPYRIFGSCTRASRRSSRSQDTWGRTYCHDLSSLCHLGAGIDIVCARTCSGVPGVYAKASWGSFCSTGWAQITTRQSCQSAAAADNVGLPFQQASYAGYVRYPGCFHYVPNGNVYFNPQYDASQTNHSMAWRDWNNEELILLFATEKYRTGKRSMQWGVGDRAHVLCEFDMETHEGL